MEDRGGDRGTDPAERVDGNRAGELGRFGPNLVQQILDHQVILGTRKGDHVRGIGADGQVGVGNRPAYELKSVSDAPSFYAIKRIQDNLGHRFRRSFHVDLGQNAIDLLVVGGTGPGRQPLGVVGKTDGSLGYGICQDLLRLYGRDPLQGVGYRLGGAFHGRLDVEFLQCGLDDVLLRRASIGDQTLLVFAHVEVRAGSRLFENVGHVGGRRPLQGVNHHRAGKLRLLGHNLIQQVLDHQVVFGTCLGDHGR